MTVAFLYDAVRSPRGKARPDGGLAELKPETLVGVLVDSLRERTNKAMAEPGALLLGCVTQAGAQGGHIALASKLAANLPDTCAAHTINNYCASGLSAIGHAIAKVASGQERSVVAGGVEMMSHAPFLSDRAEFYTSVDQPPSRRFVPPVLAADRLAHTLGIGRAELDAAALVSQQRAAASDADPVLQASRIPAGSLTGEECTRPGTTAKALAAMPSAFAALQTEYAEALGGNRFDPLHTLAHAPPVCDGAGLALVGAANLGPAPRARVLAYAESGGDPAASLTAGLAAMDKALVQAGLSLAEIDRIEFMEAFAVTIARFLRDFPVEPERVNVSGGHLAKGHPMGATGAILTSTLLDVLDACDGRLGLVVATGAMGVGAAIVVERI
ncbi:Putative acyltransferase [Tsuneonella dongtanensis]|uniref:Putative acyltransferase n=1 Tax=Tsuneonella dongtanensis TaxID=692370 RepID=A0A1B2ADL1_9SPHN|nr:beta-ketoacyl synthase N-terminal-like domain-containing protein [Tsuneonella dongtanensis]ANY20236.1 Putative acyltransferase [Tsuneonella dongtanensis]